MTINTKKIVLLFLFFAIQTFFGEAEELKAARKKALIIGVTGQDGAYLSELLLSKGYDVHGLQRRSSVSNTCRINHLICNEDGQDNPFFTLHCGDITDSLNITQLVQQIRPDEIYNLAAQSHVLVSFEIPEYTGNVDAIGALRVLEAIRFAGLTNKTKFYQASTSELYGEVQEIPQNENTPFYPRSPYGVAKLYAFWITKNYRESYNMFACNGILFNHESPIRGESFVTRKIANAAVQIKNGLQETLFLGNLNAKRDWGHARDYVEAMWLMLQQDHPEDYVIATGETHSVREFVEASFAELGIPIIWKGTGIDEKGINAINGKVIVKVDPKFFRPAEVNLLLGDPSKAKNKLKWEPKTKFDALVKEMIQSEIDLLKPNVRVRIPVH